MKLSMLIEDAQTLKNDWIEEWDIETAAKWIKENAPYITDPKFNKYIYRVVRYFKEPIGFIQPSKHIRSSFIGSGGNGSPGGAANNNLNTLLSNLPSWQKFQNRSKSVICSTLFDQTVNAWGSNVYVVIPKQGATITYCNKFDLWHTMIDEEFYKKMFRYMGFAVDIGDIQRTLFATVGIKEDVSYDKMLEIMRAYLEDKHPDGNGYNIAHTEGILENILKTKTLSNAKYPYEAGGMGECWTESDCLYIAIDSANVKKTYETDKEKLFDKVIQVAKSL